MAIPTSRTKEKAQIFVNTEKCDGCGKCVAICSDNSLKLQNNKAVENTEPYFGCIGCGHCMCICPQDAIEIRGRTISPQDLFELPPPENAANYEQILALYQRRRSIRKFRDKAVPPQVVEQILKAARTAPMGLPPSDVSVVVFDSKEKSRAFATDFCEYLKGMKWFVSKGFLFLMRPFWGKANDELFKGFVKPMFKVYTEGMQQGRNMINYDAPLALYFYGSPYSDPADPIIAASYAMLAGESLGLGTCMLGAVHPLIQNGSKARKLREKYGIKFTSREGLFVIFGYPSHSFRKGIDRSFANIGHQ